MPIYSGKIQVLESTNSNIDTTFAQILYENQLMDMTFFEALIAHDMKEVNCLAEGTLLEAEVKKLNMDAAKEFVNKKMEALKKWWEKIRTVIQKAINAIKNVCTKIYAYAVRINNFIKGEVTTSNWPGKIKDVKVYEYDIHFADYAAVIDMIDGLSHTKTKAVEEVKLSDCFQKMVGRRISSSEDFDKYLRSKFEKEITVDKNNLSEFINAVKDADKYIKMLETLESDINKRVNAFIENRKRSLENDNWNDDSIEMLQSCFNSSITAMQDSLTIYFRTMIKIINEDCNNRYRTVKAIQIDIEKLNSVYKKKEDK